MKAVLRWIASNVPLMVLALILASLAWVVAVEGEDPTMTQAFPQSIPVEPSGLPEGMVIVGDFSQRVNVTVRAPESILRSLKIEDFRATIDLAGLGPAEQTVPIEVNLEKEPSEIISREPEQVTIELESETERVVPVRVQIEGEPALGYLRRSPTITPREVTVKGPTSFVTQVVEAAAQISVQDANSDVEAELSLQPLDAEGESIPNVTLLPETVRVRIPIELSGYYRPLAVKVVLEGQIAPGYRVTNISVEPPTVTVFGAREVIAALQGFIDTQPIDVEGAQTDVVKQPALNVPENVTLVPGQSPVEVRVSIEPIQSSLTVESPLELQGLEPGLATTVSPESVQVIVSGPLPLLEALEPDDVRVIIDLFGLSPGTHQVEPQEVIVPEGVTAESILPATVQVEIFSATATPTASASTGTAVTATITSTSVSPIATPTVLPTVIVTSTLSPER